MWSGLSGMCGKSSAAAALARERATTPTLAVLASHALTTASTELLLPPGCYPCERPLASHYELQLAVMDSPRPKNSSSSITSPHAASGSQPSSSMAPSSRTVRGSTPTASRSASKLVDDKTATRPASRDSLKQKMVKKADDGPRPNRSEEVSSLLHAQCNKESAG
jgi:hypothetical protein